jgi:hypothetical protein
MDMLGGREIRLSIGSVAMAAVIERKLLTAAG